MREKLEDIVEKHTELFITKGEPLKMYMET